MPSVKGLPNVSANTDETSTMPNPPDLTKVDLVKVDLTETDLTKTTAETDAPDTPAAPVKLTLENDFVRVEEPHIVAERSAENDPPAALPSDDDIQTSYTGRQIGDDNAAPKFKAPEFNALLPAGFKSIDVTPPEPKLSKSNRKKTSASKPENPRPSVLSNTETEDLIQSNEDLQSKISVQNAQIKSLRDDIIHITMQLDDAHQVMCRTRQDLSVSDTTLAQRDMDLRDALMVVSTLTEKTRVQTNDADAYAARIETLRGKLSVAGKTLESLKGQRTALKQAESNNAVMIEQLTVIQVEITGYKRKVDGKIKAYLEKIRTQDTQIAALKSELIDTKNLVSETAETLTIIRDRSDSQTARRSALEERVLEQAKAIKQAELELSEHRNKNVALARRLNETLKQEALGKVSPQPSESDKARLEEAVSTLKIETTSLKAQLSQALNQAKTQASNQKAALDKAEQEKALSADDLSRVQDIITQQAKEITALQVKLAAAQTPAKLEAQDSCEDQSERYAAAQESLEISRNMISNQPPAANPDIAPAPAAAPAMQAKPPALTAEKKPLDLSFEDIIFNMKLGGNSTVG